MQFIKIKVKFLPAYVPIADFDCPVYAPYLLQKHFLTIRLTHLLTKSDADGNSRNASCVLS